MPALVERPKLTKMMYKVLQQHIMRERERKKQEQEQDELMERLKKEREQKKKQEERDNLTLEQTKEEIQKFEQKLESLKQEKHTLFLKLKKILNQEEENRKRVQIKEQSELNLQASYAPPPTHSLPVSGHPVMLQPAAISVRPQLYKPPHIMHQPVKRQRSPSPPPHSSASYQTYAHSEAKYPHSSYPQQAKAAAAHPTIYQHQQPDYSKRQQAASYPQSQASHVVYANQPGASYQQGVNYSPSQSQAGKYNPANPSAFQSYPSHYTQHQQKAIGEAYSQGYAIQRAQQPAYLNSPHSTNLQQLEHQKPTGFNEEKFKIQQPSIRGMAPMPGQQPALMQQLQLQQQQQQQAPPKGSIVTGYPARTQGSSQVPVSSYQQPTTVQSNFNTQQGGRASFSNSARYYP
ncbi:hypothetical protein SNE40_016908 [Patella caerulea]|uniref:G protein pathway suppressor 2 n=1 Tax=Patella caerulea TaxID=87958 RepID=A0AAN8JDZ6_PATCE